MENILWKKDIIQPFLSKTNNNIIEFVKEERKKYEIYPAVGLVMNSFKMTPFDKVRIVIIGQDPYHTPDTSHGLAFSSLQEKTPPSLTNIFKELRRDLYNYMSYEAFKEKIVPSNNLTNWAKQGILLMNRTLTVRKGEPGSHFDKGWEELTTHCIKQLSDKKENIVFMLWGKKAQELETYIDVKKHLVLKTTHPSPFSADKGFLGCGHFSKALNYLWEHENKNMINIDLKDFFDKEKALEKIKKEIKEKGYYFENAKDQIEWLNKTICDDLNLNIPQIINFKTK